MEKMTDEQVRRFEEAQESVLEKISIFKLGLLFPADYANQEECCRKQWLDILKKTISCLDCRNWEFNNESFSNYTDLEIGMMLEKYFARIREIFLQEFGKIICPFETILSKYEKEVIGVFKNQ